MSHRGENRCRPLVNNEILRQSRPHGGELQGEFCASNSSIIIKKSSSPSVSSIYSIIAVITRIFPLNTLKSQGKKRETGCFPVKVTNCVSTKMGTKTRYHTWGPSLRSLETIRAYFGCLNSLCILDNKIITLFIHGILITKEWSSKEPCALNLVKKKKLRLKLQTLLKQR